MEPSSCSVSEPADGDEPELIHGGDVLELVHGGDVLELAHGGDSVGIVLEVEGDRSEAVVVA